MKRLAPLLIAGCLASKAGAASIGPYCGWVQNFCECGSLFAVLETEDGDEAFEARLRERAEVYREQVYMRHGQTAGERLFEAWITSWRDLPNDTQSALMLADTLAKCEVYLTREKGPKPKVIVSP